MFSCLGLDGLTVPTEASGELASSGQGSFVEARASLWPMPGALLWETFSSSPVGAPSLELEEFCAPVGVFFVGGIFWFFPFAFSWARVLWGSCAVSSWCPALVC